MLIARCRCGHAVPYDPADGAPACCPRCHAALAGPPEALRPDEPLDGRVHVPLLPVPGAVTLLVGLCAIVVSAWISVAGAAYFVGFDGEVATPVWTDVRAALFSPLLPAAMAMLLALRFGVLDLSVWGQATWGGILTWLLASRGAGAGAGLLAAIGFGAAVGLGQGAMLRVRPLPGWLRTLVTLAVGWLLTALAWAVFTAADLQRVPWAELGALAGTNAQYLVTILLYIAALAMLLGRSVRRRHMARSTRAAAPPTRRSAQFVVAMAAGGALAGGAGACAWLSQNVYGVHWLPVGDLRVLVAAILCGAWSLRWRGSTLLTGLLLPVAMVVATAWWQMVWDVGPLLRVIPQIDVNLLVLLMLALGAQWVQGTVRRQPAPLQIAGAWLAWAGVLVGGLGAWWPLSPAATTARLAGGAVWLVGVALLVHDRLRGRGSANRRLRTAAPSRRMPASVRDVPDGPQAPSA